MLDLLGLISSVRIGDVGKNLNMKVEVVELRSVNIIQGDMNSVLNMGYGQNVGHVVGNHGKQRAAS